MLADMMWSTSGIQDTVKLAVAKLISEILAIKERKQTTEEVKVLEPTIYLPESIPVHEEALQRLREARDQNQGLKH
ncbi:MAG: hypothetical protein AB9866_05465 [Syntrophobacteraceae bacterium]